MNFNFIFTKFCNDLLKFTKKISKIFKFLISFKKYLSISSFIETNKLYFSFTTLILFFNQIFINKDCQCLTYVSHLLCSHLLHSLEDWLLTVSLKSLFHVLNISILNVVSMYQHFIIL